MLEWKRGGFPSLGQECLCKLEDKKFTIYLILKPIEEHKSIYWYDEMGAETFIESEIECWIPLSEIINNIQ